MEKVIIRRCSSYNEPKLLESIIREGMLKLGFAPKGNTMIKINEVAAFPRKRIFKYATTPPEFLDATIRAINSEGIPKEEMTSLYLGGKCGITIPTRFSLKCGGQWAVLKKHGVKARCFDEEGGIRVSLTKGVVHKELLIPKTLHNTDTIISLPRLKANPFTTITASLKMNIGMLDDRERLKHHHYDLDKKIVDILEVAMPSFIAVDGIIAGANNMLDPDPYPMGIVIMGSNPVAVDSMICHIIGVNPMDVTHIRIAHERGYGPVSLDEIMLSSDIRLDELKERGAGFTTDMDPIDQLKSKIKFYVGNAPGSGYCFGGCPGAMKEALSIIERLQPGLHEEIRPMHVIFGDYKGEITAEEGERIFLLGTCTKFEGKINGKSARLDATMKRGVLKKLSGHKKIHAVEKCPISVAQNILMISHYGKTANPYLDKNVVLPFARDTAISKIKKLFNR